jgi:hypothetical protein
MNAKQLLNDLLKMHTSGIDLSIVTLNYRDNPDSDVKVITYMGEDLYDCETNFTLESIVFMNDASQYE